MSHTTDTLPTGHAFRPTAETVQPSPAEASVASIASAASATASGLGGLRRRLKEKFRALFPDSNLRIDPAQSPYGAGLGPSDPPRADRFGDLLPHMGTVTQFRAVPREREIDAGSLFLLEGPVAGKPEALGFALAVLPQTGVSDEMLETLKTLGLNLPLHSTVTVMTHTIASVMPRLERLRNVYTHGIRTFETGDKEVLTRMVEGRTEFLARVSRGEPVASSAPLLAREFRTVVSVVIPFDDPLSDAALSEISDARTSVEATLLQAGLPSARMEAQNVLELLRAMANPEKHLRDELGGRAFNPLEELRHQVMDADTEVTIGKHGIEFRGGVSEWKSDRKASTLPSVSSVASVASFESPSSSDTEDPEDPEDPKDPVTALAFTVQGYPAEISVAHVSALLGDTGRAGAQLPGRFALAVSWQVLDQRREKDRMGTLLVRSIQMSHSQMAVFSTQYGENMRHFRTALKSFESEGGIAYVRHALLLFTKKSRMKADAQTAVALGKRLSFDLIPDTAVMGQSFLMMLPLGLTPALAADARRMERFERRTTSTATNGAPWIAGWSGNGCRAGLAWETPLVTLLSRRGQIFHVDPFANVSGNYSMTIVGKSGSGKSVLMNELCASALYGNGVVWVIDVGRSYEKLAHLVGGTYLDFASDRVRDLNPFRFALAAAGAVGTAGVGAANTGKDGTEASGSASTAQASQAAHATQSAADLARETQEMVVRIIEALLTLKELPDRELSILRAAVDRVVTKSTCEGRVATLDDLFNELILYRLPNDPDHTVDEAVHLAAMLSPYTKSGPFGRWFDGSGEPVDLTNRFTVLELEGLGTHKPLRNAVLLSLMLAIEGQMMKLPKERVKLVVIDEAWDLMGEGSAGHFIESGYRRARKLNGGYVTATQSIADYWKSPTARAAWDCADTRMYLRQDPDAIESLRHDGKLASDEGLRWAIGSLTTIRGAYSEMVVKVGDGPFEIGRLALDPYSRVAYSTLPAERAALEARLKAGMTLSDAIADVARGEVAP